MPLTFPTLDHEHLRALLRRRNCRANSLLEIDQEILTTFQRRAAVLVLDMVGFTRATVRDGIVAYLALIEQMEMVAGPVIERNAGVVVKREADNLYAVFELPQHAIEAALNIRRTFDTLDWAGSNEQPIQTCMGIGYGDLILVGRTDVFGYEMNLACKLGEDAAAPGEILVTQAAHDALPRNRYRMTCRNYRAGETTVSAFRFEG
jgi:adenylate cyclase